MVSKIESYAALRERHESWSHSMRSFHTKSPEDQNTLVNTGVDIILDTVTVPTDMNRHVQFRSEKQQITHLPPRLRRVLGEYEEVNIEGIYTNETLVIASFLLSRERIPDNDSVYVSRDSTKTMREMVVHDSDSKSGAKYVGAQRIVPVRLSDFSSAELVKSLAWVSGNLLPPEFRFN